MMTIITSVLGGALAILVLGFLYLRMIKREVPDRIGIAQALVPIVLGGICMPVSGFAAIGLMKLFSGISDAMTQLPLLVQSWISAFMLAGFSEELFKFIAILITLAIFRNKVDNVYECILIGAAVGFGFTIVEDASYAESVFVLLTRLPFMCGHFCFNMIMGAFLGRAKYNRIRGEAPVFLFRVLALVVPVALHTIYDSATIMNRMAFSGDLVFGLIYAVIGIVIAFGTIIFALINTKKKAEEFCAMKTLENMEEEAA